MNINRLTAIRFLNRATCRGAPLGRLHFRTPVSATQIRFVWRDPLSPGRLKIDDEHLEQYEKGERQINPLDEVTSHRVDAQLRAYYKRRMYFAAFGLAATMVATFIVVSSVELPDATGKGSHDKEDSSSSFVPRDRADSSAEAEATFQGKTVVVTPGTQKIIAQDPRTHEEIELVETGTSTIPHFPRIIKLPRRSSESITTEVDDEYTLLGLGIRTVSFLSIQVYVVGIYVKTSNLSTLQASLVNYINPLASALIPSEKSTLRSSLIGPEESFDIWEKLLKDARVDSAIRVVPTRSTDFKHLRDGWVTGVNKGISNSQKRSAAKLRDATTGPAALVTEFDDESFGAAMRDFKAIFGGRGSAPKGSIVLLRRGGDGALDAFYQAPIKESKSARPNLPPMEPLGELRDERVSRLIWLGYLSGSSPSSEAARKSVVDGIMGLVERPMGTVETKIE